MSDITKKPGISDALAKKQAEQAAEDKALAAEASELYTAHQSDSGILGEGEQRTTPPKDGGETFEEIQQGVRAEREALNKPAAEPAAEPAAAATIDRIEGDMAVVDIGGTTYDIPVAALQALGIQAVEGAALSHSPAPAE